MPPPEMVGRTPWSAADAPVGSRRRDEADFAAEKAGPGGPARTRGSAPPVKEIVKMKVLIATLVALLSLVLAGCVASGQAPSAVEGLRCEYLVNPLGIDVEKPRLSWALTSGARGARAERLPDSGGEQPGEPPAEQRRSVELRQGGLACRPPSWSTRAGRSTSGMRAWWKVRVWDEQGRAAWSGPAHWSMGLLRDADWQGRWIGLARPAGVKEGTPSAVPVAAQDVHAR